LHTSDKDWFKVFELASKATRGIICAPGDSPGSVTELSTLYQSQMIAKIVFFMPPTPAKAQGLAAMNAVVSPFVDPVVSGKSICIDSKGSPTGPCTAGDPVIMLLSS
jgi:hypothetical protein